MRSCNGGSLSNHQEVLIKRYYEIHFDYSTEFKNTSVCGFLAVLSGQLRPVLTTLTLQATVQRKRDSMELMQSSRNSRKDDGQDSSVAKLLREKTTIAASMKSINDVIRSVYKYLIFSRCTYLTFHYFPVKHLTPRMRWLGSAAH